jgi:MFS family permease
MRELFRHRDMRLLFAGEACSLFGDRAMFLAFGVWVKTITGSNAAAGLVFFAFALPSLFSPFGGMLVDRLPRRQLMIAVDLCIAATVLSLLLVHGRGQLWLIYAVAVLYGACGSLFGAARSALLTEMLPSDLLPDANGLLQTASQGMRLVGPLAGAGLFAAFGGGTVAAIDAGTFGVSALCLALLRARPQPAASRPREQRFRDELAAGARHIMRTLPLRQIVLALAATMFVVGFLETLLFAITDQGLHSPPSFIGVLIAVQGVGALAGGITAARLVRRIGDGRTVGAGIALLGVYCALAIVPSLPVVLCGVVLVGVSISWAVVGYSTAVQQRTPDHLQGRAYSASDTLLGTPQTISIALGAGLIAVVDYRLLLLAIVLVSALCAAYLLTRTSFTSPEPAESEPVTV